MSSSPTDRHRLGAAEILSATDALFAADGIAAQAARRALSALLAQPAEWERVAEQFAASGLVARHLIAPLGAISAEPCELALVRLPEGDYLLLHRQEPHWRRVDATGEAAEIALDFGDKAQGRDFEIVTLRLPHDRDGSITSLSQLWPMLRRAWMEVGAASLFVNAGLLLVPLFSMLVYDKVVSNGIFETLWALVAGMVVYLLMDSGMRIVRAWSIERIATRLAERNDERIWQRLLEQKDFSPGGFASFLAEYRNLALARDFVSASFLIALIDLPFFLLFLIVIGLIAWPLLVLLLILALIYGLIGVGLQARMNRLGKETEQTTTRKLAFMSEALNALDVARTAPASSLLHRRWRHLVADTATLEARRRLTASHSATLAIVMSTLTTVCILTLGTYLIDARLLTVGGLIAGGMLAARTMSLVASLFTLISKWEDFRRATTSLEAALAPSKEQHRIEKPQASGRIDVLGLTREYKGRPIALDNVSFAVAPGERIALLGRPGCGKTTLLRCLAGLSQPDSGQILIDGVAIDDISPRDRARWLAYKAQEPALFAGSLDENLRISGCPPESARFTQALWASGLEDELRSGRMTLGMQIAERGQNLSGGQRQKVALARAFAQRSRILLLDEPTLGLDAEGEKLLTERLPDLLGDGVLIVSTHSAAMLQIIQRVIALDAGKIIADGAKEQLLKGARAGGGK